METTIKEGSSYTPDQIDALREIGNIGASHASTALTTMLHQDILVDVPECFVCRTVDAPYALGDTEQSVVAVYLGANGKEKGSMLLVVTEDVAMQMTDLLLSQPHDPARQLNEEDQEGISEIGNICASAYLNAISNFLGITILPTPPGIAVGMLSAVMEYPALMAAEDHENLVIIKTNFIAENQRFPAYFIYIPDRHTENLLMEKFGI
jgi:chemotaxis protein CheC